MENDKDKTVWIVIGIIAALLLGCVMGACSGGLIGYSLAKRAAIRSEATFISPRATVASRAPSSQSESVPVLVTRVVPDSPAEKAGIMVGDKIIALGGVELTQEQTIDNLMQQYTPGDTLTVTVLRSGRQIEISIILEANPSQTDRAWLGIYYRQQ